MSLDLEEIYELFGNPLEKQVADIRNKLGRSKFQKDTGDTKLDIGSLGLNSQNYVKPVNDHYNIMNHTIGLVTYYPAFEPDYNYNKLWLNTDHFGYKLVDDSLIPALIPVYDPVDPEVPTVPKARYPIGQDITLYGEPKLESGFDRGYGDPTNTKKRQALHFNRLNSPTRFQEYIKVKDQAVEQPNKTLRITDVTIGATWIFRMRHDNFLPYGDSGKQEQCYWAKIDADNYQNAVVIFTNENGQFCTQIRKGNVDYAVYDASGGFSTGSDQELALVFNPAGATTPDKMKIYRNGVLKTSTVFTARTYGDPLDHDLYIGKRGAYDAGYIQGYPILVKYFHDFIATDANILSHYTNKLTIAGGIGYGQVAVPDIAVPTL